MHVDENNSLELKEEVEGIMFSPNYEEKEPIFQRVFEELSNQGNGSVDYHNLQERLLSTGKFYAGEAVLMIDHMVKEGKIEQTGDYHLYRIKESAPPNGEEGSKVIMALDYSTPDIIKIMRQ
jgi:hypothetical protein